MSVENFLVDHAFLESFLKDHEYLTALEVSTVEDSVYRCFKRTCMSLVLTLVVEVVDRVAVCEDDTVVTPLAAEDVNEKTVACTARLALVTVVCAHHLTNVTLLNEGLECREVCLPEVTHRNRCIISMTEWLRTAVYGIMLCACVSLEVLVVVTLHTEYILYSENCVHVRVLTVSLLTASPSWVTEDVHVRTPECELRIARVIDHAHRHIVNAL